MQSIGIFAALVILLQLPPLHGQDLEVSGFSNTAVPSTYVGLNDAGRTWTRPWPTIDVSAIRLFDAQWPALEPAKGQWDFEHVDRDVDEATKRHQDLDLILTATPTWASARPAEAGRVPGARAEAADVKDWEDFVRTVAKRYKGRVHTYELWNEPNLQSSYTGDIPHLVALCQAAYRTLKEVDPSITVVSPSLAHTNDSMNYLRTFLVQGGAKTFDVLGYHFYDNLGSPIIHPENIVGLTATLRRVLASGGVPTKPIWNTESGYYIASSPEAKYHNTHWPAGIHIIGQYDAVDAIGRGYVLGWGSGLQRFYWYAWGEPAYALVDDAGATEKKATQAYKVVRQWLVGSRYVSVNRSPDGLWVVILEAPQHRQKVIVWTESHPQNYTVPPKLHLTQSQDLLAQSHPLSAETFVATPSPQLLF